MDLFCAGSHSFLSGRQQRVVISGSQSIWLPVLSGVPQGTVLEPLLFLLYINDIDTDVTSEIRLFADDCMVYRTIKSSADCVVLQSDIRESCSHGHVPGKCISTQISVILPIGKRS